MRASAAEAARRSAPDQRPCGRRAQRLLPALLALASLLGALPAAQASPSGDAQRDPGLRSAVQKAIADADCFSDQFDSAVWYALMEPKLRKRVSDRDERLKILKVVYCEAHRDHAEALAPGLIMAIIDVESGFNRWAVSNAGAVGLMQVMPFWPERLGMQRHELTSVEANVRMGCAILRFYLQNERYDVRRALARYNGSVGRREYPDSVVSRWTRYWNGADDLGRVTGFNPR